jgi:hypothetical protein
MRFAVEMKNPLTNERRTIVVELSAEQLEIADNPRNPRSSVLNGFACSNAAAIAPQGFGYWGGPITPVAAVH